MKKYILTALTAFIALMPAMAVTEMTYGAQGTAFALHTLPAAKAVKLRIYADGTGGKPLKTVAMQRKDTTAVWQATVKGDLKGRFYTFDVKYGKKYLGETPGVNARAVGVNGRRAAVIDLVDTDPVGWRQDRRPGIKASDLVVYELHHRDFSIDSTGGFRHPGKFLALTEPRALQHLRRLGVNAVHLLPSFDYASVDESRATPQYNWGYDPLNYNVPEGSYSTDAADPLARIREFKQMVQALHSAGIAVVLDVVYNHTFNIDGSNFQLTCPDLFYRRTADGNYSNGSGCGNETASEREAVRRFIVESVRYWAQEYHIDGFRFDLMGVHDMTTMREVRRALTSEDPAIFIYGEGWSAGGCALPADQLATKDHVWQMPGVAAFSDEMRDGLRGPWSDDAQGAFLAGIPGHEESVKMGLAGAIDHPQLNYGKVNYSRRPWALQPTQMMSYVSCHDDMCLVDRLRASVPGIDRDDLISLHLLAHTAVLTSQGVPFLLSGEEMLRTKLGVHNSYNSPDSVNRLDWDNLERYPQVMAYLSALTALRARHPALHLGDANLVKDYMEFLPDQPCLVAFHLRAGAPGESWGDIYVALNANAEPRTITVPDGTYTVVCRRTACCEQGIATVTGPSVTVPARSALIIHN